MEAVKNWLRPLTQTDIRIFLGLAGYYQRFMDGFASIESSLTTWTQKSKKFEWSEAWFMWMSLPTIKVSNICLPKGVEPPAMVVANVVADALSQMTMGIVTHIDEEKKDLEKEVHRFSRL
ncbi:hypothetical protein EJD97_001638 [Solanum chilense]|uniref:Reverse transcriptase/retrotransposon-derived protein RNase H-like domain-containing protein n=1 Tax=Solanum chilense TaxID=4083 RepID=A0A6N2CKD9_SOLCI|nr:hypothetical protein EJD97_001638 [Solanum chilense]